MVGAFTRASELINPTVSPLPGCIRTVPAGWELVTAGPVQTEISKQLIIHLHHPFGFPISLQIDHIVWTIHEIVRHIQARFRQHAGQGRGATAMHTQHHSQTGRKPSKTDRTMQIDLSRQHIRQHLQCLSAQQLS